MKLQSKILKYLNAQPCVWAIKVEVANQRGCPDILCCVHGQFIAIEVKAGRDRVSAIQTEQLRRIYLAGGTTFVATNYKEFVAEWKQKLGE